MRDVLLLAAMIVYKYLPLSIFEPKGRVNDRNASVDKILGRRVGDDLAEESAGADEVEDGNVVAEPINVEGGCALERLPVGALHGRVIIVVKYGRWWSGCGWSQKVFLK